MSDSSTFDESERKAKLDEYYFQRKVLFGCTVGLFAAIFLWIIAISTNRWFIVSGGDGIFVESHRRYFKSSHTGIWRNCRYALNPQPVSPSVVRNFTVIAVSGDYFSNYKSTLEKEDFIKDLQRKKLPDLSTITENNDEFRKHLFAEWFDKNPADFNKLKEKFQEFHPKKKVYKSVTYLDPSNHEEVINAVGELVSTVNVNSTTNISLIVPEQLNDALFDGWIEHGMKIPRILSYYAKSLQIDPSVYHDGVKFVFRPPKPPKNLKHERNGFTYQSWRKCTYHNLFADEAEIAADPAIDEDTLDLTRTAATFSVITVFVMVLGFFFTVYTFLNPRYMFKRLAGGVHFIAGISSATVCRMLHATVQHAQEHLKFAFPDGAVYTYGYGFFFGCLVAIINFISCLMFFWYSRKRKGDKAATEELGMADEVIQIGR